MLFIIYFSSLKNRIFLFRAYDSCFKDYLRKKNTYFFLKIKKIYLKKFFFWPYFGPPNLAAARSKKWPVQMAVHGRFNGRPYPNYFLDRQPSNHVVAYKLAKTCVLAAGSSKHANPIS
ncbi:hypothetical protein BpHYR1_049448 [Brachionus plicatilis]|uniref:Uncharacterized protein n=1 Tax=Brachionus plicatilis TaxID=10195 RepID=A0A3M7SBY1_BRAPC|nr:hypothetical protein BpHYR1_049448 [Brachionus plicatilis]